MPTSDSRQAGSSARELCVTMTIVAVMALSATSRVLESSERGCRCALPVVSGQHRVGVAQDVLPRGVVGQDATSASASSRADRPSDRHVARCLPVDLASDGRVQDDRRDTGGKRFQRRQSESLVLRQEDEHRGARIQIGERRRRYT